MLISGVGREFIIKDTHRGLYYEDGKLTKVLEAGRYKIPPRRRWFKRLPIVECLLVDVRQRELTIKGQEILTADKVAIRVSILVQFRVTDPMAAIHTVDKFRGPALQRCTVGSPSFAGVDELGRDPHEPEPTE